MDRTRTGSRLAQDTEVRILARIVDAMLSVQDELAEADDAQWTRILVDACRQEKRSARPQRPVLAAAC
jgi:hypothetical protein